jgi:4-hydroxy-tetrahydrodipicolinate synthase
MKTPLNRASLKGVFSALLTPFEKGEVDYESLEKLVQYQLRHGINGFVVNGTTAESPTLEVTEVEKIFQTVKRVAGDKVPLILGTGSNSTQDTIEQTRKAHEMGADAALVVVPYYNKPPQRGLDAHFRKVADSVRIPVILYNVPGRTITGMTTETIQALSSHENIVGIKEASGDVAFDEKMKAVTEKDFILLSGDDPTYLPFLKLGGHGIISVMSNLITAACAKWTQLAQQNKYAEAEADFAKYKELIQLMYVEANPIPIKWMLYKAGLFRSPELRLPLVTLDEKYYSGIEKQMKLLGLM